MKSGIFNFIILILFLVLLPLRFGETGYSIVLLFITVFFERTQRYIRHKRKKFIENDIRALEFRKFLKEEGLYGMELGNEELVRFIEWQKKNEMERL